MASYKQIVAFKSDDGENWINTGRFVSALEYPFREFTCYEESCTLIDIPEQFSTGRAAIIYWYLDGTFKAIPLRRDDILQEVKE